MVVGRIAAALVVMAVVWAPTGDTVSQFGGDAARTSVLIATGPGSNDVVWRTQVGGTTGSFNNIVFAGGSAYLSTFATGGGETYPEPGVWRIRLSDGSAQRLDRVAPPFRGWERYSIQALATDGSTLFAADHHGVGAYTLDGDPLWRWRMQDETPLLDKENTQVLCPAPAVDDGFLTIACIGATWAPDRPAVGPVPLDRMEFVTFPVTTYVARFDLAACEGRSECRPTDGNGWRWMRSAMDTVRQETDVPSPAGADTLPSQTPGLPTSVAVIGNRVLVSFLDNEASFQVWQNEMRVLYEPTKDHEVHSGRTGIIALDRDSGQYQWSRWTDEPYFVYRSELVGGQYRQADPVLTNPIPYMNIPTGDAAANRAFVVLGADGRQVESVNLEQGYEEDVYWTFSLHREEASTRAPAYTTLAYEDDTLYVASERFVYRLNTESGPGEIASDAHFALLAVDGSETWAPASDLVLTPNALYMMAQRGVDGDSHIFDARGHAATLYALDRATLAPMWTFAIEDPDLEGETLPGSFAIHDGLAIVQGRSGEVVALGESPSSIPMKLSLLHDYPSLGQEVKVALEATGEGIHGPADRFRVEWGDGNTTGWVSSPELTHHYDRPGNYTVRATVGNAAGQTTSRFVAVHAGLPRPSESGLLSTIFAQDHQDTTWGVIGLLVVLLGGFWGLAARKRKHRSLRSRLQELEQLEDEASHDPVGSVAEVRRFGMELETDMVRGRIDPGEYRLLETRFRGLLERVQKTFLLTLADVDIDLIEAFRGALVDGVLHPAERRLLERLADKRARKPKDVERLREWIDAWCEPLPVLP